MFDSNEPGATTIFLLELLSIIHQILLVNYFISLPRQDSCVHQWYAPIHDRYLSPSEHGIATIRTHPLKVHL